MRCCLRIVLVLVGPAPLLVGREEGIRQRSGASRRGREPHGQRQQQAAQPVHPPAATHGVQRDQQQRPAQPVAGVLPVHLLRVVADCLEVLPGMQLDPVQVVVVQGQAAQRSVCGTGQLLDGVGIETGQQRASVGIDARLPMGIAQNATILAADGKDQHLQLATLQVLADLVELGRIGAIGQQHQGAGRMLGGQQTPGLVDHAEDVLARPLDKVGRQRLQEGIQQFRIVRRRQHHMCAAGIGDQCGARPCPALDQVVQLVLGGAQARRRNVVGVHRGRQVQREDQRCAIVEEVRTVLPPGRPGGGDPAQDQQCSEQVYRAQALLLAGSDQQAIEQMWRDDAVELARQVVPAQPEEGEGHAGNDQQQPERTQEVEGAEVQVHLRPPIPLAAGAPRTAVPPVRPTPGKPVAEAAPHRGEPRTGRAWAGD
ncbi:hypothetical protein D9M71_281220 [compost metagenome]